jgi:hypothetical protein
VSKNEWEQARRTPGGIEKWIDENMKYKSCVVVLVGSETADRPWVQYEIAKGWDEYRGIVGIFIHNLKDPRSSSTPPYYGKCAQGANPFTKIMLKGGTPLSNYVPCHSPDPNDAYNDIARNLTNWIANATRRAKS